MWMSEPLERQTKQERIIQVNLPIQTKNTCLDGRAERLVLAPAARREGRGRAAPRSRGTQLLEQEEAGLEEPAVAVYCVLWCGAYVFVGTQTGPGGPNYIC